MSVLNDIVNTITKNDASTLIHLLYEVAFCDFVDLNSIIIFARNIINITIVNIINSIEQQYPMHLSFLGESAIDKDYLATMDMMVVSMDSWKRLMDGRSEWLVNAPSVLVVKP